MQNKKFNWEGFKSEISGVRFEEGKDFVTSRSKDYFWGYVWKQLKYVSKNVPKTCPKKY